MDNEKEQRLRERLLPEMEAFKSKAQTLMLATLDKEGKPNVSYAPFSVGEEGFYILVSDLAKHGMNLKENKYVSVMLVQDETEAKTVFARKRLTFDVEAQCVDRDCDGFAAGIAALEARFGEIALKLSELVDFNLYCLRPNKGLFVKGFGQAFAIGGEDLNQISWMTGEGKEGHIRRTN